MRARKGGFGTDGGLLGAIMRQNQSNYPPLVLSSPTSKAADWAEGRHSERMNEGVEEYPHPQVDLGGKRKEEETIKVAARSIYFEGRDK